MNMFKFALFSVALGVSPTFGATLISLNSGAAGINFVSSSGAALATGSVVRIGSFDLNGVNDTTVRNSNVFSEVDALFNPLGEQKVGGGSVTQDNSSNPNSLVINDRDGNNPSPGEISGSIGGIDDAYFASGTQLYVWVFNAATTAEATEWGIFTAPAWTDPTPIVIGPTSIGNRALVTSAAGIEALRGTVNQGVGLNLDVVPEPSVSLLLLGVLGALSLRRRR